jgi:hypothetical protein
VVAYVPPPSDPPIAFKLIGIVEGAVQANRVAVLSDGRGIYHGSEGDIIEGRFRLVRIAADSVEMARVEGGTPQVIRLQGDPFP